MTLTLGLASVFILNGSLQISDEIFVHLPQIKSDSPVIVYPQTDKFFPDDSGGGGGGIIKCNRRELTVEEMKKIDRMTK
ncbi:MAG: hypothetical protein ABIP06_03165 [Pyrinomonadaceae bacterium]